MPVSFRRKPGRSGFSLAATAKTTRPRRRSPGQAAIDRALVLTTEAIEDFEAIYSACYSGFQPQGEIETRLVNDIATAHWRMRRMQRAETETLNAHLAASGNAPGTLGQAILTPEIRAFGRYEQRCFDQMLQASALLRKLEIARRRQVTK